MSWDPAQYRRFAAERRQPFDDLVSLCRPVPGGTVVDLGCGTGELTAELHRAMAAASTTGVDSSAAMLAEAPRSVAGLRFVEADLARYDGPPADLVFANASLQWVSDHPALLGQLRALVRPGGQLAFQVPANFSHPSHVVARQVASRPEFLAALGGELPADRGDSVLSPEAYAERLHELGARPQVVRLQIYGHELDSTADVVEWVRGTLLVPYRERLDDQAFERFVAAYRARLLEVLGDRSPYFYGFARILCWAAF